MKRNKFVCSLLAVLITILLGTEARAQQPAAPPEAYTAADLSPSEVFGLWKTLRKFKLYGARTHAVTGGGALVRTTFAVQECPVLDEPDGPYTRSWTCFATVKGAFKVAQMFYTGIDMPAGRGEIVRGAQGDTVTFSERVQYSWDAAARLLMVFVTYANDPGVGLSTYLGSYNVQGVSETAVKSSSKNYEVGVKFDLKNLGGSTGFNMEKAARELRSRLLLTVGPNGYTAETGEFIFRRDGAQTVFWTTMNWLTDAFLEYQEQLTTDSVECESKGGTKVDFSASFKDWTFDGDLKSAEGTTCRAFSDAFTAKVLFRAQPAQRQFGNNPPYAVGQRTGNRIVVWKLADDEYKSFYESGLTSVVNWELDVESAEGSKTGGGFEVGSTRAAWDLVRGPLYVTRFAGAGAPVTDVPSPAEPGEDELVGEPGEEVPAAAPASSSGAATLKIGAIFDDQKFRARGARVRLVPLGGGQEWVESVEVFPLTTGLLVSSVQPGAYDVTLEVDGLGRRPVQRVDLGAGGTASLTFRWPEGSIEGVVRTGDDEVQGAAVTLWRIVSGPEGNPVRDSVPEQLVHPDRDGRFEFRGLPAGRYLAHAKTLVGTAAMEVTLAGEGSRGFATLEALGGRTLVVHVMRNGQPLEGVTVYAVQQPYAVASYAGRTDSAGQVTLEPLPPGEYYLRATQPSSQASALLEARSSVSLSSSPSAVVLELE